MIKKILFIDRNATVREQALKEVEKFRNIQLFIPSYSDKIFLSREEFAKISQQIFVDVEACDVVVTDFLLRPGVNENLFTLFDYVDGLTPEYKNFIVSDMRQRGFPFGKEKGKSKIKELPVDKQKVIHSKLLEMLKPLNSNPFIFHPKEVGTQLAAEAVLRGKSVFSSNIGLPHVLNDQLFIFLEKYLGIMNRDGYFERVTDRDLSVTQELQFPRLFELQYHRGNVARVLKHLI